jgi:hypothetical protein
MGTQGICAAASLVLLKGPRKQGGDAMKLTIMELVAAGKFSLQARDRETQIWVSANAVTPANPTQASVFGAALDSSEDEPLSPLEIAHAAKWVHGDPRASSLMAWLYRLPLKELYNRDLMHTRRRLLLRNKADVTQAGRRERLELKERMASLESNTGSDRHAIETVLGLAEVREAWPGADAFAKELNRMARIPVAGDASNVVA